MNNIIERNKLSVEIPFRMSVIGKMNQGKSTFVNQFIDNLPGKVSFYLHIQLL